MTSTSVKRAITDSDERDDSACDRGTHAGGAVAAPKIVLQSVAQHRAADEAPVGGVEDLAKAIGRHLYENQKKIWPHIKEQTIERPWWYEPRPASEWKSPFSQHPRRERSSDLTGDEAMRRLRRYVLRHERARRGDEYACRHLVGDAARP